ncbi:hypothetical protein [Paludisphaera mucosa]|uniref:Uncharacterized protein n=1 Tax=Paludisphaera mucosa TaxID=3030827 RepID=A0ABT6FG45_9BACT|nr:hypothetical protein [Paludisphaera mucosa]MDG3006461.1 hypothetical protein [Paludisphaera mucosa]
MAQTLSIPPADSGLFTPLFLDEQEVGGDLAYFEIAHPDDVSRRSHEYFGEQIGTRYALFGLDLERGVVLRGRLRGVHLPPLPRTKIVDEEERRFLDEPPPLRTA